MKYYLRIFLSVLLSAGILVSCKKENSKDYSASIKDKTWWGQLAYTGQTAEYYCVHFNADNSLVWSQQPDDYPGQWILDGKHLTISLNGNSVKIQADISNDDILENITDNTSSSEINSGQRILTSVAALDNTLWKGTLTNTTNFPIQMNFLPGTKVGVTYAFNSHPPSSYTRSASGVVIRTTVDAQYKDFCILISDKEMKGNHISSDYPFQTTKQ